MSTLDLLRTALEVLMLSVVIYAFIRFLQETRGSGVLKGFIFAVVVFLVGGLSLAKTLDLQRIQWIADRGMTFIVIGLLVVFQPELRQALVSLGDTGLFGALSRGPKGPTEDLVVAVERLKEKGLGAIIVIEAGDGLGGLMEGPAAVRLDATVSTALLVSLFAKESPLHDGAVLLRGDRLAAAGCVLPLSENARVAKALGTRHRAALGVTEDSDALAIVVSEETRTVSVARRGRLETDVGIERLRELLVLPVPPADGADDKEPS